MVDPYNGIFYVTDIMNRKARLAWELYLKMETSGESFSLLQLIANDCYKVNSQECNEETFCLCENKGADQLRSNCEADQRLCFCYTDSTIPLLSKSKISSL